MNAEPFFLTPFSGILSDSDRHLSVSGMLTVTREGDLQLSFDDVSLTRDTFWIHERWQATALALNATTPSQLLLSSKSVYLSSVGTKTNADGEWTTLSGIAVWLEVNEKDFDRAASAADTIAEYFVVGLRGFQVQALHTRAGTLQLRGAAAVKNFNEITGRLNVHAGSPVSNLEEWIGAADEAATDALDIVSFAEGRLIRWSVRRLVLEGKVISTEYRGPARTGSPRRGFHHWLDLQPVLYLASNYTTELKARTGIDVALEWSLMNPRYTELDFVTCMTALEHLTDMFEASAGKSSPPGRAFFRQEIAPRVREAIASAGLRASSPEESVAIEKATGKINDLNRTSLQDSIERMVLAYGVPMRGLESSLPGLIKLRNEIVHRGIARDRGAKFLQGQVGVVRELLIRIFLKLLNYQGTYDSYLSGQRETISFPSL